MKNETKTNKAKSILLASLIFGTAFSTAAFAGWWPETPYERCVKTCAGTCDWNGKCHDILQ